MDEGFTATVYPNVLENLKLTVDKPVILEEPASSTRTLSSLEHLAKDFSFGDQFFNDKPSKVDNEKTTADTEAKSMVSVTIHQDTFAIPPMTSPVIDLVSRPDSPNVHRPLPNTTTATLEQHMADLVEENQALEERLDKQGQRMHQLETKDLSGMIRKQTHAMRAPLRARFKDLPTSDMKEILLQRMLEENYDKVYEDHKMVYEALQKSIIRDESEQFDADKAEERTKNKKRHDSPKTTPGSPPYPLPPPPPPAGPSRTSGASGASGSYQSPPPPPPPSNNQGGHSTSTAAPSSSKTAASAEYTAWTMTDTRIKPFVSPIPEELHIDDDTMVDEQAYSSSGEDVGRDHIPTINLRQSWWKPLTEDRPATPGPAWSIPSSDLTVPMSNWASALKSTYTPPRITTSLDLVICQHVWTAYCKKAGSSNLLNKDLEGPAYENCHKSSSEDSFISSS
ncbi:hypothetical protein Tco_1392090 [Tanacetum coccineum]